MHIGKGKEKQPASRNKITVALAGKLFLQISILQNRPKEKPPRVLGLLSPFLPQQRLIALS